MLLILCVGLYSSYTTCRKQWHLSCCIGVNHDWWQNIDIGTLIYSVGHNMHENSAVVTATTQKSFKTMMRKIRSELFEEGFKIMYISTICTHYVCYKYRHMDFQVGKVICWLMTVLIQDLYWYWSCISTVLIVLFQDFWMENNDY